MGFLLDIVPNHMCVAVDANWRWRDVLENGPSSSSARFFDIDWRPPKAELLGRVLLPVLPDQFGRVIVAGEFTVAREESGFVVRYGEQRLPLAPKSWTRLLSPALTYMREVLGDTDHGVLELESIVRALIRLPNRLENAPDRLRERQHEVPIIRARVAALFENNSHFRDALERVLSGLRGRRGDVASFDELAAFSSSSLPAEFVARRGARDQLPSLLRHQRFGRHPGRKSGGLSSGPRAPVPVGPRAIDHRSSHRSRRRALRSTGLFARREGGWEAAVPGAEPYVVVEKILGRGERLPQIGRPREPRATSS